MSTVNILRICALVLMVAAIFTYRHGTTITAILSGIALVLFVVSFLISSGYISFNRDEED